MKMKKIFPVLLLIIMAVIAILLRHCNGHGNLVVKGPNERKGNDFKNETNVNTTIEKLDRTATNLFYTKHARCRMKCRHITQEEIRDILVNGTINYNKSNLQDARGATYAVEGSTNDRQHVRIIFAPKQQHLTVVTVIDLEVEYQCNCN